jgi:predicted acetyltransferase
VTGHGPDIRLVSPDDDLTWELDLSLRAWGGPPPGAELARQQLAEAAELARAERLLGAFDGPRLVASASYADMRQWWHGRALPMAGVTGVQVAPEERGRGTGRALTAGLLRLIGQRGYPLSVLYPATGSLYRSLGWELAGAMREVSLPPRSLGSIARPPGEVAAVPLRRAGVDEAAEVIGVLSAIYQAARYCGPATWDAAATRRWLADPGLFGYLAGDGFLAYGWQNGNRELLVSCLLAASAETTRALWAVVGSHSTMAGRVRARVLPDDPVSWLIREPDAEHAVRPRKHWMLRVLDARAAIAGRGFPPAEVTANLRLEDEQRPANAGTWRLEISRGSGVLSKARTKSSRSSGPHRPVALGARGFAALYSGVPMATLRRAGLASGGDPGTDEALDCAFAADAFLLDDF